MKTSYWIIIGVVVLLIVFFVYRNNKNKQSIADDNVVQTNQQISALNGATTSQTAQILNALFPFFQTGISAIPPKS